MSAQRPVFRIVKNGYDRFMVDDAIERYAAQNDALQQKIDVYQSQLAEMTNQLDDLKKQMEVLQKDEQAKRRANENIARMSLQEANEIISTAHRNADEIIRDALSTSQAVMSELSSLYHEADQIKKQMNEQLAALQNQLDDFKLPQMPDSSWLKETEKKLH